MRKTNVCNGGQPLNKKAFTLIELLAVIVILAIIALIATPIILNIIDDSKEESKKRSAENYLDAVELAVANKNTKGKFNPTTCEMTGNSGTCTGEFDAVHCGGETACDSPLLEVKVDGEVPIKATIMFENGTVADATTITMGKSSFTKENGKLIKGNEESIPEPVSFAQDSWDTIAKNVRAGNIEVYKSNLENDENNTKEVELEGFGTFTVRIANTSTPEDCATEGFSQTACGFVIEFEDIITLYNMNPETDEYPNGTNVGGWRDSEMREYVNETIYNALPEELKKYIKETKVVSSHGSTSGETNFITEDKLYLLSTKELYGKAGTSSIIYNDTAEIETRQLDYYKIIGVTTSNVSGAKKLYNGSSYNCWFRSASTDNNVDNCFYLMITYGGWSNGAAVGVHGVAPAFRIG